MSNRKIGYASTVSPAAAPSNKRRRPHASLSRPISGCATQYRTNDTLHNHSAVLLDRPTVVTRWLLAYVMKKYSDTPNRAENANVVMNA